MLPTRFVMPPIITIRLIASGALILSSSGQIRDCILVDMSTAVKTAVFCINAGAQEYFFYAGGGVSLM